MVYMRVEPRRKGLAIRGGRVDGGKRRLDAGELDLFGDVEQAGRHQRCESGRQRVPPSAIQRIASGPGRHAAADGDSEVAQRLLQRSRAVQRVRTEIEEKPMFLARDGAAADRGCLFQDGDRQPAPGYVVRGDESRQSAANDDDWCVCCGGHASITFQPAERLQARSLDSSASGGGGKDLRYRVMVRSVLR